MKLRSIIVDDEPLALDILEGYTRRTPALELTGRFTSGADVLEVLHGGGIDLAFLDIQMPGIDGIDLARALAASGGTTRVVFTTAFPDYALEGFRVDALDYLLKPVSFEEFSQAVERAVTWFARNAGDEYISRTVGSLGRPQTLIVKSGYKQFVIPLGSIVYIEGIRDYIRIHTLDAAGRQAPVQTLMNLKAVEEMLPADCFARVHRSYIVALDRVVRLERGRVILENGSPPSSGAPLSIPVSDTFKPSLVRALAARAL